ncbi:MAG: PRC-barrel domain-containing protein, partial [Peptococcaceae bacterium]|nr:PRC-barrel domain-containing protein [Peptococcaceae bacterium]
MRRGKEIIGLPIIDLSTGQRITEVKDLVCDQQEQRIAALLLDKGNLLRKSKIIAWENIYSVGHDAVTISSTSVIQHLGKIPLTQGNGNRYL